MADQPDGIMLIYSRRLDDKMNTLVEDNREIKQRLGLVEELCGSISRRVDRFDPRLERVERRLDIAEADAHA